MAASTIPRFRFCRYCGEPTTYPDRLCSGECRREFYGETNAELYEDERRPYVEEDEADTYDPDEEV